VASSATYRIKKLWLRLPHNPQLKICFAQKQDIHVWNNGPPKQGQSPLRRTNMLSDFYFYVIFFWTFSPYSNSIPLKTVKLKEKLIL